MSIQENTALAKKMYQFFSEDRYDEALALTTDDVEIGLMPFGQTFHGHDGFRMFMMGFKGAFPDLKINQISHQIVTEDAVVTEFKAQGTHTGPLLTPGGEVPATGRTVHFTVCEVWQVRNGKLAALRNYQDMAGVMQQLGLLPEPEAKR